MQKKTVGWATAGEMVHTSKSQGDGHVSQDNHNNEEQDQSDEHKYANELAAHTLRPLGTDELPNALIHLDGNLGGCKWGMV